MHILLMLFYVCIILPSFDSYKGANANYCKRTLQNPNYDKEYQCKDGRNSYKTICFPSAFAQQTNISDKHKVSRRFEMVAPYQAEPLGKCLNGTKYREEFSAHLASFLDDYGTSLLMELAINCGEPASTSMTAARMSSIPLTNKSTTATTTAISTVSSIATTTTKLTTTTPVPRPLQKADEVPNSYKVDPIYEGCTISVFGKIPVLPKKKPALFNIQLLFGSSEPITVLSETMFIFNATDTVIKLESRFEFLPNHSMNVSRRHLLDAGKEVEVTIKVFNNNYTIYLGGKELGTVQHRNPMWTLNYTYINGHLDVDQRRPILVLCPKENRTTKPIEPGLDWSYRYGKHLQPMDLKIRNFAFNSGGSLNVNFLLGCVKLDLSMCQTALKIQCFSSQCDLIAHELWRQGYDEYNLNKHHNDKWEHKVDLLGIEPGKLFNLTLTMYFDVTEKKFGFHVEGQAGKYADVSQLLNEHSHIYDQAEYVQIKTEGDVTIGTWIFDVARKPPPPYPPQYPFRPRTVPAPRMLWPRIEQWSWSHGDCIKLNFSRYHDINIDLHRGFRIRDTRDWDYDQQLIRLSIVEGTTDITNTNPEPDYNELGEVRFNEVVGPSPADAAKEVVEEVQFSYNTCPWSGSFFCDIVRMPMETKVWQENVTKKGIFPHGVVRVLRFTAHKNESNHAYVNGFKFHVLDGDGNKLITYTPTIGPPFYIVEYATVVERSGIHFEEDIKFCKANDKGC